VCSDGTKERKESKEMTELLGIRPPIGAPKIEGKKNFNRKPARHAGLAKKDFVSKVVGLESHTFDVGEAKYAAKYQKSVDAIALQGRT
jgi:hypothetical protein